MTTMSYKLVACALLIGTGVSFPTARRELAGDEEAVGQQQLQGGATRCTCEQKWEPICVQIPNQAGPSFPGMKDATPPKYTYQTFPNVCEAKCAYLGDEYAKHSDGECVFPPPLPENKCIYMKCKGKSDPVCLNGKTFPSQCVLTCLSEGSEKALPWKIEEATKGACKNPCASNSCSNDRKCVPDPGPCFEGPGKCSFYKCIDPKCNCNSQSPSPVCAKGRTFTNQCFAACEGATDTTMGECAEPDVWRNAKNMAFPYPTEAEKNKMDKANKKLLDEEDSVFAKVPDHPLKPRPVPPQGMPPQQQGGGGMPSQGR